VTVVVIVVALLAATITFAVTRTGDNAGPPPGCRVTSGSTTYTLGTEQAAHATTIAAVGKHMGLPDHAVTVALAAALQESRLHNLDHGDRDSRGLFQQRPSQGWGTASQVMTPRFAAGAFFRRLAAIDGWESLPVNTAAQRVQRSAAPDAYAQWEAEARVIAQATTGEIPAGLSCRVDISPAAGSGAPLRQAMAQELGSPTLGVALPDSRGWTVATWLVGHATQFGLNSVTFSGQVWTPSTGRWQPSGPPDARVQVSEKRAS
jgi:hypothetical protein